MMKSLVVNCSLNESAKIEELLRTVKKFSQCIPVRFEEINADYEVEEDINAIILSGSKARIVNASHRDKFKGTIDSIKSFNLPVLGICYGHQLLCWSLGCEVRSLSAPVKDVFEEVNVVETDEIFAGFEKNKTVPLAESHWDYVTKDSLDRASLVLLADSHSCEVEAIKHKKNPFYGVQFHPERTNIKAKEHLEGHRIIENFYRKAVKR